MSSSFDAEKKKKKKTKRNRALDAQLREDEEAEHAVVAPEQKKRKERIVAREEKDEFQGDDDMEAKEKDKVMAMAKAQRAAQRSEDRAADAKTIFFGFDDDDDDDEEEEEEEGDDVSEGDVVEETLGRGLSESESRLVDAFLTPHGGARTFADVILAKIAEKEAERDGLIEDDPDMLPPQVVKAFASMAPVLKRYRSGKLPKALKVLPSLERWDEVLWLTRPDEWSPQCVFAATKIFASNLDPARAKVFYNEVLLERAKEDIRGNKRLNYHLYQALHKALFKPAPWFKGILLPLATSETTLREAVIIGSILAKASIPVAHAAVVVYKLAQLKSYNGAASVFLVVFLNKKFALPIKVIHALIDHFLSFNSNRFHDRLPVLWHQSLLAFVQRYKHDIPEPKREKLKLLLKLHNHHAITPAIRRELAAAHHPSVVPMSDD